MTVSASWLLRKVPQSFANLRKNITHNSGVAGSKKATKAACLLLLDQATGLSIWLRICIALPERRSDPETQRRRQADEFSPRRVGGSCHGG